MFHALEEVPLYKTIKISQIGNMPVMMNMANTGHLQSLPAVSVRITMGGESIFFSGDRGRSDVSPPYTAPALEPPNSVDT
jgi:hypothetical protein